MKTEVNDPVTIQFLKQLLIADAIESGTSSLTWRRCMEIAEQILDQIENHVELFE